MKDEIGSPIPYVNIWVENEDLGTTSDKNGNFYINAPEDKKLVFSAVGFESKKAKVPETKIITLKKVIFELEEVVVYKSKKTNTLEIGGAKKENSSQLSGTNPWIYAKFFRYDEKYSATPFLKEIIFYTESRTKEAKLKVRLFAFNDSIPTQDLMDEELIVTVKEGMQKNKLDLSKYNLRIPKAGVVVGLEWMIIDENKFIYAYTEKGTRKKIKQLHYAPNLVTNYIDEETTFSYSQGKWLKYRKTIVSDEKMPWSNKVTSPAIGLILTN